MGRHLKNRQLETASYSVRMPIGSGVLAPDSPVDGLYRYNSQTGDVEVYIDDNWRTLVVQMNNVKETAKDTFVGDGSSRIFGPLRYTYQAGQELLVLVFVGNVFQNPGVAYLLDGDQIEFTSAPPSGHTIIVLHGYSR